MPKDNNRSILKRTVRRRKINQAIVISILGLLGAILVPIVTAWSSNYFEQKNEKPTQVASTSISISTVERPTQTQVPILISSYEEAVATSSALYQTGTLVYGPSSGELISENDRQLECNASGLILKNFILKVQFTNPQYIKWMYGISFGHIGTSQETQLRINSSGAWEERWLRASDSGESVSTTFDGGLLHNLDKSEGGINFIFLYVNDNRAIFFLNEKYVTTFETPTINKGSISLCIDYQSDYVIDGVKTSFENFSIWSLP